MMLGRQARLWQLVKKRVRIVGMPRDQAISRPVHDRCLVDADAGRRFCRGQHAAVAKSIVARAQRVSMDKEGNAQRGEASVAAPWSSRSARTKPLLVEDAGDFVIDVIVEELVDELDGERYVDPILCSAASCRSVEG